MSEYNPKYTVAIQAASTSTKYDITPVLTNISLGEPDSEIAQKVGGDSSPIQPFKGEVPSAGTGEQKVEINMGGVTIEIKADSSKPLIENIEEQEQEIAERVAAIFKNVLGAQFANMPLKGGA